ncbi:MAG: hypothetical protein ABSF95_08970 [Verrucomicrobiota bacterium]|jgi:hypothetical protein
MPLKQYEAERQGKAPSILIPTRIGIRRILGTEFWTKNANAANPANAANGGIGGIGFWRRSISLFWWPFWLFILILAPDLTLD